MAAILVAASVIPSGAQSTDADQPTFDAASVKVNTARGALAARNVPLPTLAEFLSKVTGRLVVDDSGLTGSFDIDLRWSPEAQPQLDAPSIFTALPEQVDLRLEPRRAPLKVLVVDSIARPTPD